MRYHIENCWLQVFAIDELRKQETIITLSGVHLCCGSCQKAVEQAVAGVEGASVKVDREAKTVTISATDDVVAQKAADAIRDAGFYGKSDNDKVAVKTATAEGQSSRVELVGFHNCCGGCEKALNAAVRSVDGVKGAVVTKKSIVVEGDFAVASVLKALNDAGFSASVKN